MAVKIEINLTNKWFYSIIAIFSLLCVVFGAYAYNNAVSDPGHGGTNIWISASSGEDTLQNVINAGFPRKNCIWRQVPNLAMQWTCNDREFVAGIGYEDSEWINRIDNHAGPEINRLYCCKIG